MEHRCDKRKSVKIDVVLYRRGRLTDVCRTRDVGIAGLFLETGSVEYNKNSIIDVEFVVELSRRHKRFRSYRLPAMIVRTANDGVGLMFVKPEAEAILAWRLVVQRAISRAARVDQRLNAKAAAGAALSDSMQSSDERQRRVSLTMMQGSYKVH
jgi:hypothetical protein